MKRKFYLSKVTKALTVLGAPLLLAHAGTAAKADPVKLSPEQMGKVVGKSYWACNSDISVNNPDCINVTCSAYYNGKYPNASWWKQIKVAHEGLWV